MPSDTTGNRRKYDVDVGAVGPTFGDMVSDSSGAASVGQGGKVSERIEATYFDTVDHRLAGAGLTLRRSTGGADPKWQVQIPGADSELPFELPAGRSATVPAAIRKLLWASTRGEALRPIHGDPRTAATGARKKAKRPSPKSPAGDVVLQYVNDQLAQIRTSDPLVRIDQPGSVHRMRVATRRLRSSLQTFETLFLPEAVAPLRSELKWLAGELGAARDAEVMRDRMLTAMDDEDRQVNPGPHENTVDTKMAQAYRAAHDGLLRALNTERYHRLVVALHDLANDPPLTAKATRPAGRILPRRAARVYARLEDLVTTARKASTSAERDTQLHEARKAAKKARYAAETLTESFGKPAARFAAAMENLQEVLGVHQDSVVMRARLEQLARKETSTTTAFTYGRLHAHEEQRGESAVDRFQTDWSKSKKKSLRAWFS